MISQINIGACPRQNAVCEHYSEKGCCVYGVIKNGMEDYYNHKSYKVSADISDNR